MSETELFDLDEYEDVELGEVVVKDPMTGNSTGVVFTLAGPEHPARRKLRMAAQRRIQRALEKTGRIVTRDPEEQEEDETELLVAATLGWKGLASGGKPLPFSREAAHKVYTDPKRRWLRDQIKTALEERERFMQRSART
jgi:hypothetical protein